MEIEPSPFKIYIGHQVDQLPGSVQMLKQALVEDTKFGCLRQHS